MRIRARSCAHCYAFDLKKVFCRISTGCPRTFKGALDLCLRGLSVGAERGNKRRPERRTDRFLDGHHIVAHRDRAAAVGVLLSDLIANFGRKAWRWGRHRFQIGRLRGRLGNGTDVDGELLDHVFRGPQPHHRVAHPVKRRPDEHEKSEADHALRDLRQELRRSRERWVLINPRE